MTLRSIGTVTPENVSFRRSWRMDQSEDPKEPQRKIEQAGRIAASVTDQTTIERLRAIGDLQQKLRQRLEARRSKQEITVRTREIGNRTAAHWPRRGVLAPS